MCEDVLLRFTQTYYLHSALGLHIRDSTAWAHFSFLGLTNCATRRPRSLVCVESFQAYPPLGQYLKKKLWQVDLETANLWNPSFESSCCVHLTLVWNNASMTKSALSSKLFCISVHTLQSVVWLWHPVGIGWCDIHVYLSQWVDCWNKCFQNLLVAFHHCSVLKLLAVSSATLMLHG